MSVVRERPSQTGNRVTAGLASLSPKKRHDLTKRQLDRIYQNSLVKIATDCDHAANAPTDAGRDMTNREAQAGIVLEAYRIEHRLRRLNSSLWFQRSNADPEKMGVYHRREDGELQFLCGMEAGMNPEFTVTVNDEDGKFQKMVPGWRRVLMRLIRAKLITEPGAYTQFGPPSRDSERWMNFTT